MPIIDALSRLPSPKTTRFLKRMRRKAKTGYARLSAKKALERMGVSSKRAPRRSRRPKRKAKKSKRGAQRVQSAPKPSKKD